MVPSTKSTGRRCYLGIVAARGIWVVRFVLGVSLCQAGERAWPFDGVVTLRRVVGLVPPTKPTFSLVGLARRFM